MQACTGTAAAPDATSDDGALLASLRAREARDSRSVVDDAVRSLFFEQVCMRLPIGFAQALQIVTEAVGTSVVSMCSASVLGAPVSLWPASACMWTQLSSTRRGVMTSVKVSQRRGRLQAADETWKMQPAFFWAANLWNARPPGLGIKTMAGGVVAPAEVRFVAASKM